MAHHHDHGHDHGHDHSHAPDVSADNERRVIWAAIITGLFMVVEFVGGWLAGSLALMADAGHMLTDLGALLFAWVGFRLARRPADLKRTFGYYRFPILAAFVNGLALFAIAAIILVEAGERLMDPQPVAGWTMLGVAVAGLVANIATLLILSRGSDRENLNIRGAVLHVLSDLLGSVGAILAALVIHFTDWTPIDPILSVVVSALVLRSAYVIVRRSGHILLEGAPLDLDGDCLLADLESLDGVARAHHLHIWSLDQGRPVLSVHIGVAADADPMTVLATVKNRLADHHGVVHSTVQIEPAGICPDGGIGVACQD